MCEEEKKPTPWEAGDPKLPVVQSGHFEKKRAYGWPAPSEEGAFFCPDA